MTKSVKKSTKRIVVKLGTQVVIDEARNGPAISRLKGLVQELVDLRKDGVQVLLVSSGAVGLGRQALQIKGRPTLTDKQACAAVGQTVLMNTYQDLLDPHNIVAAQILLTADDFSHRGHHKVLEETMTNLLRLQALPIINENDTVSTAGIRPNGQRSFDDNDKLSALVAGKLNADILVILTNVEGVFTDNPTTNPSAKILRDLSVDDERVKTSGTSALGRGGMASKLAAAKLAAMCGVTTIISSGFVPCAIRDALTKKSGTCIAPRLQLSKRKQRIGVSAGYSGVVIVDGRARKVLVANRSSLLPVGVVAVEGEFGTGDVVSIQDETRREIGRGITEVPSGLLKRILQKKSSEARAQEPQMTSDEVVHRDHLVIFEEDVF